MEIRCAPIKLSFSIGTALVTLLGVDRERKTVTGGLYDKEDLEARRTLATRSRDCFCSLASLIGERPSLIFKERERVCARRDIATSPAWNGATS
jgi:hypothetical protein